MQSDAPVPPPVPKRGRQKAKPVVALIPETQDPTVFLRAAMNKRSLDMKLRIEAAKALAPYVCERKGDKGVKQSRDDAAAEVGGAGRKYASAAPPLSVVKGYK